MTNVNGTIRYGVFTTCCSELWKSDGTAAGTVLVRDINRGTAYPYALRGTNVNGTLLFAAFYPETGLELWKSDGTAAGTVLVKDINRSADSSPGWLTDVNGTLFFAAFDRPTDRRLWKSDGAAAGTVLVKDVSNGGEG